MVVLLLGSSNHSLERVGDPSANLRISSTMSYPVPFETFYYLGSGNEKMFLSGDFNCIIVRPWYSPNNRNEELRIRIGMLNYAINPFWADDVTILRNFVSNTARMSGDLDETYSVGVTCTLNNVFEISTNKLCNAFILKASEGSVWKVEKYLIVWD